MILVLDLGFPWHHCTAWMVIRILHQFSCGWEYGQRVWLMCVLSSITENGFGWTSACALVRTLERKDFDRSSATVTTNRTLFARQMSYVSLFWKFLLTFVHPFSIFCLLSSTLFLGEKKYKRAPQLTATQKFHLPTFEIQTLVLSWYSWVSFGRFWQLFHQRRREF